MTHSFCLSQSCRESHQSEERTTCGPAAARIDDPYSRVTSLIVQVEIKSSRQCHLSACDLVGVPHSDPCSEEIEMIDWRMERSMERGRVDFLSSKSGCKHKDIP